MKKVIYYLIAPITLMSCQDQIDQMKDDASVHIGEINIIENPSGRMHERNKIISIEGFAGARMAANHHLSLVSEIDPPQVAGESVMAASVDISDDLITVGYNYAGDVFKGGVDIINHENTSLSLSYQLSFDESDISTVSISPEALHYTGGSPTSDSIAFADHLTLNEGQPDINSAVRKRLGGHTGTSIDANDQEVFVVTGLSTSNGGGLYKLDLSTYKTLGYLPIADARWVEVIDNTVIVLGANPGLVTIVSTSDLSIQNTFDVEGLVHTGNRSGFSIADDLLFVAAGYSGVNVYSLSEGEHQATIPLPEGSGTDLFANSVTVDGETGYVAAGESVYLFEIEDSDEAINAEIIGRLELGNYQSINEVKYKNGFLVVAAGLGGTKLIRVGDENSEGGYELLANPDFSLGFAGWDYQGNVHIDPRWAGDQGVAFSGGNRPVTGIVVQHFYATQTATLTISARCLRRGRADRFVAAEIQLIDYLTDEVILTDTIDTEGYGVNEFFDFEVRTQATARELYIKIKDITENSISRDFYLYSLSIKQQLPLDAQRAEVKISDFEEENVSSLWHARNDAEDTEINEVTSTDEDGMVYHLKGIDRNENRFIGALFTRKATNSIRLDGFSADEVFLHFDLKGDRTNGYLQVVFQAHSADGIKRNWVNRIDLDFTDWRSIALPLNTFRSNVGFFNADPSKITTLSLSLRSDDVGAAQQIMLDNFYFKTFGLED